MYSNGKKHIASKKHFRGRKSFLILSMILAVLLLATVPTVNAEEIGKIYVESTTIDDRFESKRAEPSSTEILRGEEIDKSHTENLQEMLQSIPGVTTEIQGGDSIKIHIRGIENQVYMGEKPGVAIVIDGVPVFERTGRVNIDLDNIESVKVIKGGASYLFGDDALSGAVIITTKRGAKMKGYKVSAEAGSYGSQRALVRAGVAGEKGSAHIQATHRQTDGYHFQSDSKADYLNGKGQYYLNDVSDLTFGFEYADRNKDSHGTVTGVTQAKEDPTSIDGRDYARMYDVGLSKYFLTYSNDVGADRNLMVNLYQFSDTTKFKSSPQRFDADGVAVTDVDAYTNNNDYFQVQRGLKSEYRAGGESLAYLAAIDIRANQYDNKTQYLVDFKSSPSPKASVNLAGTETGNDTTKEGVQAVYGEIKFKPLDKTTFTVNGRFDQIKMDYSDNLSDLVLDRTFSVASWRTGMNYNITDSWDLFLNGSTGFRAPSITQLFAGDISPSGSTESNPDLKPEHSLNLEVGTRGKSEVLGISLETDISLFQITRDDYIMSTSGQYSSPDTGTKGRYDNIGGVKNSGLELSVNSDPSRVVSLDVAYTYLDAKFTKYDNFNLLMGPRGSQTIEKYDNTGNVVPRTPNHHFNVKANYKPVSTVSVSLEMDSISSYYADEMNIVKLDGRQTFNLLANYGIKMGETQFVLFARVDNLLDDQYYSTARGFYDSNGDKVFNEEDISITVNPGRIYTAGISAEF